MRKKLTIKQQLKAIKSCDYSDIIDPIVVFNKNNEKLLVIDKKDKTTELTVDDTFSLKDINYILNSAKTDKEIIDYLFLIDVTVEYEKHIDR